MPWLFISERDTQLTRQAVNHLVAAAANAAGLPHVRPHMLRHSCGFYLTDQGMDQRVLHNYLGHRDPRHTAHYSRVSGRQFEGWWK